MDTCLPQTVSALAPRCAAALLAAAIACLPAPVQTQTLRWAARADAESMDPHTLAETQTMGMAMLVHDALVERDRQLAIVPALAVRWQALTPTRWRFELRRGVRFHDGTPLTADDVVFSVLRAQQPTSQLSFYAQPLGTPVKLDDHTVELRQAQVNPLLLQHLAQVAIMSRSWTEAHRAGRVPDYQAREEAHTTRHAMGTGRFVLKERQPGLRTVYERHPDWWGQAAGNVQRIVFTPVANDATRTAALVAGDVDFVNDLPVQDAERVRGTPGLQVVEAPENRLILLGFNQGDVGPQPGAAAAANPFRDRRVREAFALAIDTEVLRTTVMRGMAAPTRCMAVAAPGCMAPALEAPRRADPGRARQLMAEAGYAHGFALAMDCPNDRYLRDQALCLALVGMLSRIGVQLRIDARPKSTWLPRIQSGRSSAFLFGWAGAFADAQPLLDPVVHSAGTVPGKGGSNFARVSDPVVDDLIDAAGAEADPARRATLIGAAQQRIADEALYLPLHRQTLLWAARDGLAFTTTPNGVVRPDWMHLR
ncbi:ABC transporter substrate-binding protein [Aquincola sp. MAHUQ-54]|uniref:ABC transporter substrate-binding protein n=1 Tax=Aquincola agrisoli TaxID=3119538 RepID=A0AAW9Q621_9BURK